MTIKQYIKLISKILNYDGEIIFNNEKRLDGTPRKIVDNLLASKLGWKAKFNFIHGIKITIDDFIKNKKHYLNND